MSEFRKYPVTTSDLFAGMYITGFWTHYLLSNASVMGKTLLTNMLWSSSTPSRFLTAVVSLEGDQARFG